jgi:hypothetical protein
MMRMVLEKEHFMIEAPFESPRAKKEREDLARRLAARAVFEDMMQASDDGEMSREDAIKALQAEPLGYMKEES